MVLNKTSAVLAATVALSASALAGEPGGFRPGLYLREVGGAVFASTPAVSTGVAVLIPMMSGAEGDGPGGWGVLAIGVLASYPFLMTAGTMGLGERYGARSGNRGEVYWAATLASLAGVAVSAAVGTIPGSDGARIDEAVAGIFFGVIPNAFLNAYVYNRVKKPESDDSSSRFSAAPYVAAYRGGRESPIPVWGVTVCF